MDCCDRINAALHIRISDVTTNATGGDEDDVRIYIELFAYAAKCCVRVKGANRP